MKWYKHDSNANQDAKLKKVRMKYGMEGYGLYWYCLELIAQSVEKHNLTFELEHDAEIIACDTAIHVDRVQEMMSFMVEKGLFENSHGRITCLKMATRTDEYTQKLLKELGALPTVSRDCPDTLDTKSELKEENRIEENRLIASFDAFWEKYPKKVDRKKALAKWMKIKPSEEMAKKIISDVEARKRRGEWKDKQYILNPTTYLNGERWNDQPLRAVNAVEGFEL